MTSLFPTRDKALRALLIAFLSALVATSTSCRKKAAGLQPQSDPGEGTQTSFSSVDCPEAVDPMADLLARDGISAVTSEGLLSLALCYLAAGGELSNRDRALELLRAVKTREGESQWARQADLLLKLVTQTLELEGSMRRQDRRIEELEREVEGLKQIDTRPRPSPPESRIDN